MSTMPTTRSRPLHQSIELQRAPIGGSFDQEFNDVGVNDDILEAKRPGFHSLATQPAPPGLRAEET